MIKVVLSIAKIHLLSRKRQTVVASLGVTFGIGVFIAMISLMTGINLFLEELMLANTAHVHLFNDLSGKRAHIVDIYEPTKNGFNIITGVKPKNQRRNIKEGLKILKLIQKDSLVEGVSPLLVAQVFYNNGSTPVIGTVNGVDVLEFDKLFNLREKMVDGTIENLLTMNNGIVMGSGLAEKLNVKKTDQINITTHDGSQFRLLVTGIFSTGISMIDDVTAYAALPMVQKILGENKDYFTDINVKLKNIDNSQKLATTWDSQFNCKVEDWKKANAEVLVGTTMRNIITISVSIALLIVAAFGIYNILTMMIYEKMTDIAILKATGFKSRDIKSIFLTEALIIGLIGGFMGLLLGFLISLGLSSIPMASTQLRSLSHLPVNFEPLYYVFGMLFAIITTFVAGWMPAIKASKIDPIEIIRGK
jgi:lipoprotein-releasing system permease protein